MYNSDPDEINDVGEGDGEGGEVGGAGGEGRDTATGIRTVSGDDDPSSDQWCTTIENHRYQWLSYPKTIGKPLIPMVALNHSFQW